MQDSDRSYVAPVRRERADADQRGGGAVDANGGAALAAHGRRDLDDLAVHERDGRPLLEGGDGDWRALGLQHLERVGIEGAREGHEPGPPCLHHGRLEDRAMAEMDAVEDAERDGTRTRVRRVRLESPDDPHAGF